MFEVGGLGVGVWRLPGRRGREPLGKVKGKSTGSMGFEMLGARSCGELGVRHEMDVMKYRGKIVWRRHVANIMGTGFVSNSAVSTTRHGKCRLQVQIADEISRAGTDRYMMREKTHGASEWGVFRAAVELVASNLRGG